MNQKKQLKLNKNIKKRLFALLLLLSVIFVYQNCGKLNPKIFASKQDASGINNDDYSSSSKTCRKSVPILPRLSTFEYGHMINDLMGGGFDFTSLNMLPYFPPLYGFDRLANPSFDRTSIESYVSVAENIIQQLIKNQNILNQCNPGLHFSVKNWENCGLPIISYVGQRLYRRPLRLKELESLKNLFLKVYNLGSERVRSSTTNIVGFLNDVSFVNNLNGAYATGWAYDPDWPERSVEIRFYIKQTEKNEQKKFIGSVLANIPRSDINTAIGINGNRGFIFPIPYSYLNGNNYELTALTYGTSTDQPLNNSPKIFNIHSSINSPVINGEMDQIFEDAMTASILSMLISSNFLFKLEYYPNAFELNEEEFRKASLLSFIIGSTFPDTTLMNLAAQKKLSQNELKNQASRLMNKYSDRFSESFGGQWVGYKPYLSKSPNSLEYSMGEEGRLVFKDILLQDQPISSLLEPGYTYINNLLSNHYQLNSIQSPNFIKIKSIDRGGMLNQAHFLTKTANNLQTNPIKRGIWVLDRVLCQTLPALSAATFEEIGNAQKTIDPNAPLVERMKLHRQYGQRCNGCHNYIDPLGLALENWDMTGRFRTTYKNGQPVISDLLFENQSVKNPTELASVLSQSREFRNCVRAKLEAYVAGTDPYQPISCGKQITSNVSLKDLTLETIIESVEGNKP